MESCKIAMNTDRQFRDGVGPAHMKSAMASAAIVTLAACLAIPAVAAPKHTRAPKAEPCTGYFTAFDANGNCVHTEWMNPDRVPPALYCGGAALCWRHVRHKKHAHQVAG